MADSTIGRTSLLIVPKFDNLTGTVNRALDKAGAAASSSGARLGERTGSGFGRGLTASGAVVGAFSAITTRAMDSISDHVGSAVSRFDTLNNYPRVMQSLGYSSESAEASIAKMSDRLSTLPTRLDDMVSLVQGLVTTTGDLDKATNVGLALNDMLVASGSSTAQASAAMEQFRQILSKGKPEMEDWRSLTTAMPGQMDQLAKSMLGPTANANDLYAALGGGKNDPTITLDQLMDKMVELDVNGGASFASFKDQAETAAGGVNTAVENMSNAVTKGITGTMDAIGGDTIAGVLNDAKGAINDAFKAVNGGISKAMPMVKELYGAIKPFAPELVSIGVGITVANKAAPLLSNLASGAGKAREAFDLARGGAGSFGEALGAVGLKVDPVSIGISLLGAGIGILAEKQLEYEQHMERMSKATDGLAEATARTGNLDTFAGSIENVGQQSSFSAMSVDDLADSIGKHVDAMNENTRAAEQQISQLNTAQRIIDNYAGKTDLSTDAQGRLTWALQTLNDQLGLNISAQDVANGQYQDADGNVQNLKQSIDELVASKKREAEVNALTQNLTEAYQAQSEAADTLASKTKPYQDRLKELAKIYPDLSESELECAASTEQVGKDYLNAKKQFDTATDSVNSLNEKLGDAASATQEAGSAFEHFAQDKLTLFQANLSANGQSLSSVSGALTALGADTQKLASLSNEQLSKLAQDYDGTSSSIVTDLSDWGVGMDEAAANGARAAGELKSAVSDMGDAVKKAFSKENVDTGEFAQACADAGVSTEQLNSVGSANLAALAQNCGGNLAQMVWAVQNFNSTPIIDKDGSVTVDQTSLVDAQGNVYTWNGSKLIDQTGAVSVATGELRDAQGNVATWNGSKLKVQKGKVSCDKRELEDGIKTVDKYNKKDVPKKNAKISADYASLPRAQSAMDAVMKQDFHSRSVTITTNYVTTRSSRSEHADGGIVSFHASGGIVDRPGAGVDIKHIAGEDGAEAVIPLTNRSKTAPLARTIAEQMADVWGGGDTYYVNIDGSLLEVDERVAAALRTVVRAARASSRTRG